MRERIKLDFGGIIILKYSKFKSNHMILMFYLNKIKHKFKKFKLEIILMQLRNYFMPGDLYSKVLKYKSSDLNYLVPLKTSL
ncbi:hypothetical protein BpHYR1_000498 [Brachionus plicatilis]|uniref:Uncharacterized protein n=1 Tax=Brachionus plicatilis TaxID=10195 RepID=A0A3M7QN05_BRAPC|nr:hypothetical protein BpHYR1_000498 [Brachionus plicatilis]